MAKKEGKTRISHTTLIIVMALILIAGIAYYFTQSIADVRVVSFKITNINDIQPSSARLSGELLVENPSRISVPVKQILYVTGIKSTGESLGTGTLPGFTLEHSVLTSVPFSHRLNYGPTSHLAIALLTGNEAIVTVDGTIILNLPGEPTIPFHDEIDIRELI